MFYGFIAVSLGVHEEFHLIFLSGFTYIAKLPTNVGSSGCWLGNLLAGENVEDQATLGTPKLFYVVSMMDWNIGKMQRNFFHIRVHHELSVLAFCLYGTTNHS